LFQGLTHEEIDAKRAAAQAANTAVFDRGAQQRRMSAFVGDILAARA
jgi:hypothetical protein